MASAREILGDSAINALLDQGHSEKEIVDMAIAANKNRKALAPPNVEGFVDPYGVNATQNINEQSGALTNAYETSQLKLKTDPQYLADEKQRLRDAKQLENPVLRFFGSDVKAIMENARGTLMAAEWMAKSKPTEYAKSLEREHINLDTTATLPSNFTTPTFGTDKQGNPTIGTTPKLATEVQYSKPVQTLGGWIKELDTKQKNYQSTIGDKWDVASALGETAGGFIDPINAIPFSMATRTARMFGFSLSGAGSGGLNALGGDKDVGMGMATGAITAPIIGETLHVLGTFGGKLLSKYFNDVPKDAPVTSFEFDAYADGVLKTYAPEVKQEIITAVKTGEALPSFVSSEVKEDLLRGYEVEKGLSWVKENEEALKSVDDLTQEMIQKVKGGEKDSILGAETLRRELLKMQKDGASTTEIQRYINAKSAPSEAETMITHLVNDGVGVEPRFSSYRVLYALEKSMQLPPELKKTPEEMFASLKKAGFVDEAASAFSEAYAKGDISLAQGYFQSKLQSRMSEHVMNSVEIRPYSPELEKAIAKERAVNDAYDAQTQHLKTLGEEDAIQTKSKQAVQGDAKATMEENRLTSEGQSGAEAQSSKTPTLDEMFDAIKKNDVGGEKQGEAFKAQMQAWADGENVRLKEMGLEPSATAEEMVKRYEIAYKKKQEAEALHVKEDGVLYDGDGNMLFQLVRAKDDELGAFSDLQTKMVMREIDDSEAKFNQEPLYKAMSGEYSKFAFLDEVLIHNKLYEKYPELKDVKIEYDDTMPRNGGSFDGNKIKVSSKGDLEGTKEAIFHEVQHWVQKKENMPRGGSEALMLKTYDELPFDIKKDLAKNMVEEISKKKNIKLDDKIKERLVKEVALWEKSSEKEFQKIVKDSGLDERVIGDFYDRSYLQAYQRLYGEQMARATQYRKDMTPEQRAKESWQQTLERVEGKYEEPIIRYDDGVAMSVDFKKQFVDDNNVLKREIFEGVGEKGIKRDVTLDEFRAQFEKPIDGEFIKGKIDVDGIIEKYKLKGTERIKDFGWVRATIERPDIVTEYQHKNHGKPTFNHIKVFEDSDGKNKLFMSVVGDETGKNIIVTLKRVDNTSFKNIAESGKEVFVSEKLARKGIKASTDDRTSYQVSPDAIPAQKQVSTRSDESIAQKLWQKIKGAYTIDKRLVEIFGTHDVSTLNHELGHRFLFTLNDAERAIAEQIFGVKNGKWSVENHEAFADAYARYIAEGKTPVKALQSIFERFKQFTLDILDNLRANNGGKMPKLGEDMETFFAATMGHEPSRAKLFSKMQDEGVLFQKGADERIGRIEDEAMRVQAEHAVEKSIKLHGGFAEPLLEMITDPLKKLQTKMIDGFDALGKVKPDGVKTVRTERVSVKQFELETSSKLEPVVKDDNVPLESEIVQFGDSSYEIAFGKDGKREIYRLGERNVYENSVGNTVKIAAFDNIEDATKEMIHLRNAALANSEKRAMEHMKVLSTFSKEDQVVLGKALDGDEASIDGMDARLKPLYETYRKLIDDGAELLVRYGFLGEKEKIKDYVRRLYLPYVMKQSLLERFRATLFSSDGGFGASVGGIGRRKEMSLEERISKGQIFDASYVIPVTRMEQEKLLIRGKFYDDIAQQYGSLEKLDGYGQVPNEPFKFGNLSGKYIPRQLYDAIVNAPEFKGGLLKIWQNMFSHIKVNKTVKLPFTHMWNINSNIENMILSHTSPLPIARSMAKGKWENVVALGEKYGMIDNDQLKNALGEAVSKLDYKEGDKTGMSAIVDIFKRLGKELYMAEDSTLGKGMRLAYGWEDKIFKLTAMQDNIYKAKLEMYKQEHGELSLVDEYAKFDEIDAMKLNSAQEYKAFKEANALFADYQTPLPPMWRVLDENVVPFLKYTVRSTPITLKLMMKNPMTALALNMAGGGYAARGGAMVAGAVGLKEAAEYLNGLYQNTDEKAHESFMAKNGTIFGFDMPDNLLGIDNWRAIGESDTHVSYLNQGRAQPGVRGDALDSILTLGMIGQVLGYTTGVDLRTKREFYHEDDPASVKAKNALSKMIQDVSPGLIGTYGPKYAEALMYGENIYGEPMDVADVTLQGMGIRRVPKTRAEVLKQKEITTKMNKYVNADERIAKAKKEHELFISSKGAKGLSRRKYDERIKTITEEKEAAKEEMEKLKALKAKVDKWSPYTKEEAGGKKKAFDIGIDIGIKKKVF